MFVRYLLPVFGTLALLCFLHFGRAAAVSFHQSFPVADHLKASMAQGRKERTAGHFENALEAFRQAVSDAHQVGDIDQEAKALLSLSGCQIRLFQYRQALTSLDIARRRALQVGDEATAGGATVNLSSVYSQ